MVSRSSALATSLAALCAACLHLECSEPVTGGAEQQASLSADLSALSKAASQNSALVFGQVRVMVVEQPSGNLLREVKVPFTDHKAVIDGLPVVQVVVAVEAEDPAASIVVKGKTQQFVLKAGTNPSVAVPVKESFRFAEHLLEMPRPGTPPNGWNMVTDATNPAHKKIVQPGAPNHRIEVRSEPSTGDLAANLLRLRNAMQGTLEPDQQLAIGIDRKIQARILVQRQQNAGEPMMRLEHAVFLAPGGKLIVVTFICPDPDFPSIKNTFYDVRDGMALMGS